MGVAANHDGGIGVGAAVGIDEKRVALGVVFAALQVLRDMDHAAVGGAALADADGLGDDDGGGVVGGVDHLGAGVLMLAVVGEGNGDDFAAGALTFKDHTGILHRETTADVAVDPLYLGVFHCDGAFGDEIKHVVGPVLDGDVLDLRALEGDELDYGGVEGGGGELRGGAALHVGDLGALVGDNEGALELAEVFRVDAEVGLERHGDLHVLGHVDEGAAGEHGAVERGELVVAGGDDLAEPFAEELGVLAEGLGGVTEDDALLGDDVLDV